MPGSKVACPEPSDVLEAAPEPKGLPGELVTDKQTTANAARKEWRELIKNYPILR
jgi:hypothetical protein